MDNGTHYIIEGGEEGKRRLDVLSEILSDYTKAIIEQNIGFEYVTFLDVGSGGGNVSRMVAEMIGNKGHVTAIDYDEKIIQLSNEDAIKDGLTNIDYIAMDACDIQYSEEFDIVYSRFLFSHLTEPALLLKKMIKALKRGGRIIIEDIDFSGHFCFPKSQDFELYVHYFTTAGINNGQNPNIGSSLFTLLKDTQLDRVAYKMIQPSHNTGKGKWMAYLTMDKIRDTLIKQNLCTAEEIDVILRNLESYTKDDTTIMSLPRIFSVWGTKI